MEDYSMLSLCSDDLADIASAKDARHEETFPAEFVDRLLAGESPIRVWRQHRGFSLQDLAQRAGTTEQDLHRIEKENSELDSDLCQRLARLLDCDPEDLLACD